MRIDLPDSEWDAVGRGEISSPDGVKFMRSRTRARRRDCDRYVSSGVPLVRYYWGGLQLEWNAGEDAVRAWQDVRSDVTVDPRPRGDLEWTAGVWTSDDGRRIVLLTGHC
jgi:hypothetical protein